VWKENASFKRPFERKKAIFKRIVHEYHTVAIERAHKSFLVA
jgi:hypothetical protein